MSGHFIKNGGRSGARDDEARECFITENLNSSQLNSSESDLEIHISTRTPYGWGFTRCCRGRSLTGALLLAWCLTTVALGVVLSLLVVSVILKAPAPCDSPDCVQLAGQVISSMDMSADPCDDFYAYTCGRWLQNTVVPPSKAKWTGFSIAANKNEATVRKLLEESSDSYMGKPSRAMVKAKNLYESCMNVSAVSHLGSAPLKQLIRDLGSWSVTSDPVSGTWEEGLWNLQENLITAFPYGSVFFTAGIDIDNKDSSLHEIYFDQGGLLFSDRDFYLGENAEKYHAAAVSLFVEVGELLGGKTTDVRRKAEAVWQLEAELAKIMTPKESRIDPTANYFPKTLAELNELIGDWLDVPAYLWALFGREIPSDQRIMVYGLPYLQQINTVIQKHDKEVLANYLVWSVIQGFLNYLPQYYREALLHFKHAIYGVDALPERWKVCLSTVDSTMPYLTGGLYVQEVFPPEQRKQTISILDDILHEFKQRLSDISWMDEESKRQATQKVTGVGKKIGFPDITQSPARIDEEYERLLIDGGFFHSVRNINHYHAEKQLGKLGNEVDRTKWGMSAMEVNAYYNPTFNEMAFPAGILQYPFYSSRFPVSMRFGALGAVMGHELTHGFDNQGSHFDLHGNMKDWWSPATVAEFKQKGRCMAEQYAGYAVGESMNDGNRTLGENIADNGGLKTAYYAYQAWLQKNGGSEHASLLPGLMLSEQQMFFVAFGQAWCGYETPEYMLSSVTTDPHSYFKLRVKGVVSNMPEFSKAFKCPVGSAMNPTHKCSLW